MRKILAVIFILIFAFAFIRITTSTYENIKRRNNAQLFHIHEEGIMKDSLLRSWHEVKILNMRYFLCSDMLMLIRICSGFVITMFFADITAVFANSWERALISLRGLVLVMIWLFLQFLCRRWMKENLRWIWKTALLIRCQKDLWFITTKASHTALICQYCSRIGI